MANYGVVQLPTAQEQLSELPSAEQVRIVRAMERLGLQPRPRSSKRLTGPFSGLWRLRVGDYRVAYQVDDRTRQVIVISVGHRSRFYKDMERRQMRG